MNPKDFQASLDKTAKDNQNQQSKDNQLSATNKAGVKTVEAVNANTKSTAAGLKNIKGNVNVTNSDLAKTSDVNQAVEAINKLNLTTFMSNEGLPQLASNLTELSNKTQDLQDKLESEGFKKVSDQLGVLVDKLDAVTTTLSNTEITVDTKLQQTIDSLSQSINAIDFKPSVRVTTPAAKVTTTPVDFSPIIDGLSSVEQAIKDSQNTESEEEQLDLTPITGGLSAVQDAITSLRFPVPNYVLPFIDDQGRATQSPAPLVDKAYDYVGMSNADGNGNYQTFVYKVGGSGGVTVRTLTYTYDPSSNVTSITRS